MSQLLKWLTPSLSSSQQSISGEDQQQHQIHLASLANSLAVEDAEKHFGLENYGNTCYCNAILQCLYHCRPFRDRVFTTGQNLNLSTTVPQIDPSSPSAFGTLYNIVTSPLLSSSASITANNKPVFTSSQTSPTIPVLPSKLPQSVQDSLLSALKDLFKQIHAQKKKTGSVAPQEFIKKLRQMNEMFRSPIHHDAHEFFNYLVNSIADLLAEKQQEYFKLYSIQDVPNVKSWVHDLFEGVLANEIKCLTCDTISHRMEPFLDLSLDIPADHVSLTSLLKHFSKTEIMSGKDKFFCDCCKSLQEAEKRLKINKLPKVLVIHLKRFKYLENLGRHAKLTNRITFPLELRLSHSTDKATCVSKERKEMIYNLNSVVVHVGNDPSHGHYISLVKSMKRWWVFDDTNVEPVDEAYLAHIFGPGSSLQQENAQPNVYNKQEQGNEIPHARKESQDSIATFDSSMASATNIDRRPRREDPLKGYGSMDGSIVTDIPFSKKGGASLLAYGCGYILFYISV